MSEPDGFRKWLRNCGHLLANAIIAPFRGLLDLAHLSERESLPDSLDRDKRPGLIRRVILGIKGLLLSLLATAAAFATFLVARENRLKVILFTPIVAGLLFAGFYALQTINPAPTTTEGELEITAESAIRDGQFDRAREAYEQLVSLHPDEPRFRFNIALIDDRQGFLADAIAEMRELAPHTSKGFGPAHRWFAFRLLGTPSDQLDPYQVTRSDRARLIRHHVESALLDLPEDLDLLVIKAEFDKAFDPDSAVEIYRKLADYEPRLLLQVANIQRQTGQSEQATATIEQLNEITASLLRESDFPPQVLMDYLATSLILGDFELAEKSLEEFSDRLPEALVADFRSKINLAFAARDIDSTDSELQDEALDRLRRSIRQNANNPDAYRLLGLYAGLDKDHQDEVLDVCRDLIEEGVEGSSLHLLLGGLLLSRKAFEEAKTVLEDGLVIAPKSGELHNNLAWLMANQPSPDLDRAMELSNRSIELKPTNASFYETRGSIRVQRDELDLAVQDFEKAMLGMPKSEKLLRELADVYQALGFETQAEAYRKRLENLDSSKQP